jgi:O-methyltransferase
MLKQMIRKLAYKGYKELMLRGYLRDLWYPRYQFLYFPRQLCFLADCLNRTSNVDGAIVEIGCAYGLTTTFLYEYMIDSGISKKYICIDTFSGFTPDDILFEQNERGKKHQYKWEFKHNNVEWFKDSLRRRHITDIEVIEGDICTLDIARLPEKVAFCLLDVDLYRPIKLGLERVYPLLSPGGMIVVDDCWSKPSHLWVNGIGEAYDGAMQAYREFIAEHRLPENFVETKLGIIERI